MPKTITLRKIATGGILIASGTSYSQVIKHLNLDPAAWEEVKSEPEGEDKPDGDSQGDARPENN